MKTRFFTGITFCSILMLCACLCIKTVKAQQYFKLDSNLRRANIPFKFIRNMVIVKLNINDKGPYNFILDTGVGLMIITDPKLVDSLDIRNKRLMQVAGLGKGKAFEAYIVPSVKVNIYGVTAQSMSAAILRTDNFGLSNFAGLHIHGLLGYEFFNSFTVRINFSDSTVTAGMPKDIRIFKHCDKLPLSIEQHKPYITTGIKVNDKGGVKENKLIVDLGAGHCLSLEGGSDGSRELPAKFIASNLGVSLSGPISGFLSRIQEIELGKYKLKNVISSFPQYDAEENSLISVQRDGNIGMEILKKFNLVIDYQNGMMYLKPNSRYGEPFEQDMSGLEYYATGDDLNHIMVSHVEVGSAAYKAGISEGDEIVTINITPVSKMCIQQIDNLFRSGNDKSLYIELYHGKNPDKMVKTIMTLKRRI